MGTLAWSPLAGGWLSGKYRKDARPPENSRAGRNDRWDDQAEQRGGERTWAILAIIEKIAASRGVPPSQVALNWLRRKPSLSSILIGARNMDQLVQNLDCVTWELSPEEETELDAVSDIGMPYPYAFIQALWQEGLSILGSWLRGPHIGVGVEDAVEHHELDDRGGLIAQGREP